MSKVTLVAALLATALATPAPAAEASLDVAAELAAMRAKIAGLEAEVAELKAARNAPSAASTETQSARFQQAKASWRGRPSWLIVR